ncbi:MAG: DUF1648 domain-containing protein [Lentisphaerae bacterium]|nr:DUF1648 domain-containing protein [Lentisphaerota bacterium]
MRRAFIVSYLANVVLALVSWALLPDRVAIHFGVGGRPDNWAPGCVNALVVLCLDTVLFLAFYFSPRLTSVVPAKWMSLPNKQFWLAPENRAATDAKVSALMWRFGTALFAFLFAVGVLAAANLADPVRLNERLVLSIAGVFLAYSLVWCVSFLREFRLPG